MAEENRSLHVVVFPWLAFGHLLPYLELSKALAKRGHKISFISTPRNIRRFPKPPPPVSSLIHFVPLPLPPVDGLPADAEATSDLHPDRVEHLKLAFDRLDQPFRQFIRQTTDQKPDWIVQDFAHHWLPPIAAEAGVPVVFFSIFPMNSLVFFGPPSELGPGASRTAPEDYTVPPPWVPFPSKVCFRLHQARSILRDSSKPNITGVADMERFSIALDGCKAVAVRSCMEMESQCLENLLPKFYNKPVIPVGLLPPPAIKGNDARISEGPNDDSYILDWLSKRKSKSVIYIAFGSEATLSPEMLHQLALGLEVSKLPFVWAFRKPPNSLNHADLSLPKGFEERCRGHGIVAKGWVPQLKILAHESVGGFLNHSGWSSVIESLQFGHPLVLLPIFGDQGLIARVVMETGIAVEIERDEEDGSFTKEAVAKALRLVVIEEEGESIRRRAQELREVFTDKDRQDKYVDDFVKYLQENHEEEI